MIHRESLLGIFLEDPCCHDTAQAPVSIVPPHSAMQCQQTIQWMHESNKSVGFIPDKTSDIKSYYLHGNAPPCLIIIEGKGQECLAQDMVYPTLTVWVHSIIRWMRPCQANTAIALDRPPVPGSLWWHDEEGNGAPLSDAVWDAHRRILVVPQAGFVSYAPVLKTWVQSCVVTSEEWAFQSKWTLTLQEWPL